MKKLLSAAFAATITVASLSSCCGKGECNATGCDADTAIAKATIDSISMAQGMYIGDAVLSNYPMIEREGNVSKEDIIKGIQLVLGANNSRGTTIGMQFGIQMINEMKQLEDMGINVDRSLMLQYFKKAFLQDTINQDEAQRAYAAYQGLVNAVQAQRKAREEARIAASPEAMQNVKDGESYLAAVMKDDPEVKTTESGLGYRIENAGDGMAVADGKRLRLKYTEKQINGNIIVETAENGRIAYLANLTPGFGEGLKMLSKGGKAAFYVPGNIAYGVTGIPSRNVGPNEMMVYEVEVIDVE